MSLSAGTRLGPYEILSAMRRRRHGEVYRARDTRLERDVAIKILPGRLSRDPDALARFEREAKSVAALSHPSILAIFDVGTADGISYAVMELLTGETLRALLAGGAVSVRKTLDYAIWSDPALTALGSIKYYEQVQQRDARVRDYFRMFLMPGVLHCGGGPGPDSADWVATIARWVESGKAPDRLIARKEVGGAVSRTRPLCPYPQAAEYTGSGSTDVAANFVCR